MANRSFTRSFWTMHNGPVLLDCNFVVDSTNGNGLGIRNLKGPGVAAVYMHTSSTPAAGNPNPAAGTIIVQLQDNYNRSFSGGNSVVSPLSGSNLAVDSTALTVGSAYVITSVGTSTAADWVALGLPVGVTPAVGAAFVALVTGTGSGSGQVQITAAAGSAIASFETVGDPNQSIAPLPQANQGFGAQFIIQTRNYSGNIAAPANGTVISLQFLLSNSSVTVQGE